MEYMFLIRMLQYEHILIHSLLKGLICPAYNASKAAVLQLGRNLAAEWGEYGIRVNTISPDYIVTTMVTRSSRSS
jgi:NAD(P)-dependent dehydrogenase (short-subunit alcohol dehydrogenase family)